MRFHILTLFPAMFDSPFAEGVIGRARRSGLVEILTYDIRDHADAPHRSVDDYAFGGGAGMVMKPEPHLQGGGGRAVVGSRRRGRPSRAAVAQGAAADPAACGRVGRPRRPHDDLRKVRGRGRASPPAPGNRRDQHRRLRAERRRAGGDGGAGVGLPAGPRCRGLGRIDAEPTPSRPASCSILSTRARRSIAAGAVPDTLLSGNHAGIERWRREESLRATFLGRPDLLESVELSDEDRAFLEQLRADPQP